MEEQSNREAKEGWRFAVDAARITEELAGGEDRKHTSGGVFIAVDSNQGAVVGAEGAIESVSGNEGRIAQASTSGIPGNEALLEAVLKRARVTQHPWLIACDANMSPKDFEKKDFGFGRIVCT